MMGKNRKRLGDILVEKNLITMDQLQDALKQQKLRKQRLGRILVDLNLVKESQIMNVLSEQLGLPTMDISEMLIEEEATAKVQADFARENMLIPLMLDETKIVIAMVDPFNVAAIEKLEDDLRLQVDAVICSENQVVNAIHNTYGAINTTVSSLLSEAELKSQQEAGDLMQADELVDLVGYAEEDDAVVKLVAEVIKDGAAKGASDVHIEPTEKGLVIRFRVDGVLVHQMDVPLQLQNRFTARLKVLAGMDIAERRLPQDGRMQIQFKDDVVDIRVSTLPIVWGEKIVLRLLARKAVQIGIDTIGFSRDNLETFKRALGFPNGIILVTGPTGSGKTSTLYAGLNLIKSPEINIVTVENPVEYRMALINQVQVRADIDYTFASALRAILRQDPDVIMVGEIRDVETAQIAIEAALTGHLVLSTVHTNDAASTITRFIEMGIPQYLLSSTIVCIVAQRLLRRICPRCREEYEPDEDLLKMVGIPVGKYKFYRGKGCGFCLQTGFKGRVAVHEVLMMNDTIRQCIFEGRSTEEISKAAASSGMRPIRVDGFNKVINGVTTLAEVMRVARIDAG